MPFVAGSKCETPKSFNDGFLEDDSGYKGQTPRTMTPAKRMKFLKDDSAYMTPEMSPNDAFLGDEDFTGAFRKLRKRINKKSKHLFTPGTPSILRSRRIREEPVDVLALLVKIFMTVILVIAILYDPVFIGDIQKGGNMALK